MFKWSILTLGQFSRNKFWGEDITKSYRGPICTSTYISGNNAQILVDPPFEVDKLADVLNARTGKTLADITHVYVTHGHGDHFVTLSCFPNAQIFVAPGELQAVYDECERRGEKIPKLHKAKDGFVPEMSVIHVPGHTAGICGLFFKAEEGKVAVVGDAIMNRDFYEAREGYHNSVDFPESRKTINLLASSADVIVPGHDNYFLVKHYSKGSFSDLI